MKVTYTGKMNIGGSGIGTTAWHQIKPLLEEDLLERVYAPKGDKVPENLLNIVPSFLNNPYEVQDIFFDAFCSLMMKSPEILQTWGSHCLFQLREFPEAISIVNLYSAHPVVQARLLKNEAFNQSSSLLIKKMSIELEECNYIFIPSEFILNSLREFGLEYKAKIVPFGVDLQKFNLSSSPEDDKFRVIYVGGNWVRKGLLYLLEAWKHLNLKNAELIVAGISEGSFTKKFWEQFQNVKWGWIPDLVKTYQDSDVFCLPAIEDGCPLATYEAMACGLPVIITTNTGTYQHVYNGRNGFIIQPKDISTIVDYLQYFYDNREEARRMGREGRKMIEAFPWERHEQEYVKWVKTL